MSSSTCTRRVLLRLGRLPVWICAINGGEQALTAAALLEQLRKDRRQIDNRFAALTEGWEQ